MRAFTHEQELELVKKWNEVVSNNDTVVYAGDFIDTDDTQLLASVRHALNGKVILVKGNHDTLSDSAYREVFDSVHTSLDLEDIKVSIAHSQRKDPRPGWKRIYGHFHRSCSMPRQNATEGSYCCCVSRNNGYPVKLSNALEQMEKCGNMLS